MPCADAGDSWILLSNPLVYPLLHWNLGKLGSTSGKRFVQIDTDSGRARTLSQVSGPLVWCWSSLTPPSSLQAVQGEVVALSVYGDSSLSGYCVGDGELLWLLGVEAVSRDVFGELSVGGGPTKGASSGRRDPSPEGPGRSILAAF